MQRDIFKALVFLLVLVFVPGTSLAQDLPPRSDSFDNPEDFLACSGNPYALCYYSGPERPTPSRIAEGVPSLPCVLNPDLPANASCSCYAITEESPDLPKYNFVLKTAILNKDVRDTTEAFCDDNHGCLNMKNLLRCMQIGGPGCKEAPVCDTLGDIEAGTNPSLFPKLKDVTLISTFSFAYVEDHRFGSTACKKAKYAGCMTAPCTTDENGLTTCSCPVYDGEYQVGQRLDTFNDLECELPGDHVWSAANDTHQDTQ